MSDEKISKIEEGFLLRYLKKYPQIKLWFKETREIAFKKNHESNYGGDCSKWPIPPLDSPSAHLLEKAAHLLEKELSHASKYGSKPQSIPYYLKGKTESLESIAKKHGYNLHGVATGRWSGHKFNLSKIEDRSFQMEIGFVSLEKDFTRDPTKFMERLGIDHYISGTLFETSEQAVLHQNNLDEDYRGGIIPVVVDDFMAAYKKRMSPHYPIAIMNKEQLDEQERHERDIIRENEQEKGDI